VSSQSQQQSLKQLFANTITDGKRLLTAQVNLTTTELSTSSKVIGQISLLAVIAISLLSIGGLFILITVAYALVALGLPVWAGFLIVAALLFLAAGTLGLVIKAKRKDVKAPALASAEWKKTSETLSALGK
jgi:ABC-type multidrug transport system permease subunit